MKKVLSSFKKNKILHTVCDYLDISNLRKHLHPGVGWKLNAIIKNISKLLYSEGYQNEIVLVEGLNETFKNPSLIGLNLSNTYNLVITIDNTWVVDLGKYIFGNLYPQIEVYSVDLLNELWEIRKSPDKIVQASSAKPTVCLDFDGVIHSYSSGWKGMTIIPDSPTKGAKENIKLLRNLFKVAIFSCRCSDPLGIDAIKTWLSRHDIKVDSVEQNKPIAFAYVDDKGISFTGDWDKCFEDILNFKKWQDSNTTNIKTQILNRKSIESSCITVGNKNRIKNLNKILFDWVVNLKPQMSSFPETYFSYIKETFPNSLYSGIVFKLLRTPPNALAAYFSDDKVYDWVKSTDNDFITYQSMLGNTPRDSIDYIKMSTDLNRWERNPHNVRIGVFNEKKLYQNCSVFLNSLCRSSENILLNWNQSKNRVLPNDSFSGTSPPFFMRGFPSLIHFILCTKISGISLQNISNFISDIEIKKHITFNKEIIAPITNSLSLLIYTEDKYGKPVYIPFPMKNQFPYIIYDFPNTPYQAYL